MAGWSRSEVRSATPCGAFADEVHVLVTQDGVVADRTGRETSPGGRRGRGKFPSRPAIHSKSGTRSLTRWSACTGDGGMSTYRWSAGERLAQITRQGRAGRRKAATPLLANRSGARPPSPTRPRRPSARRGRERPRGRSARPGAAGAGTRRQDRRARPRWWFNRSVSAARATASRANRSASAAAPRLARIRARTPRRDDLRREEATGRVGRPSPAQPR